MKILNCRLKHLTSLARSLRITWRVKLDDGRIVKVIDYRSFEDDIVEGWVEGIEFHERDLLDSLMELTESADYTYYEI